MLLALLLFTSPMVTGTKGFLLGFGTAVYGSLSIIAGIKLGRMEKMGWYGSIWLLGIGIAISLEKGFLIPSTGLNIGGTVVSLAVIGYLFGRKELFER